MTPAGRLAASVWVLLMGAMATAVWGSTCDLQRWGSWVSGLGGIAIGLSVLFIWSLIWARR